MFHFTCKPGDGNYADCDGEYKLDDSRGTINCKPVYVNKERCRFLASLPDNKWCITALHYFPDVFSKQGSFGGFHSGGGLDPDDCDWKSYSVKKLEGCDQTCLPRERQNHHRALPQTSEKSATTPGDMFHFTCKPGDGNYADCDGEYKLDGSRGTINCKPVYVNKERCRFLASLPDNKWCITALHYFPEVFSKQGSFGGFHSGGGLYPDDCDWKSYSVKRKESVRAEEMFEFTSKDEESDYADCDGNYKVDITRGIINCRPVLVNAEKCRFLAALPDNRWCITGLNYFPEVFTKQGSFGGFHSGGGRDPDDCGWKGYTVKRLQKC